MWFYEHLKHGRWWPVTTTIEPATVAATGGMSLRTCKAGRGRGDLTRHHGGAE